VLAPLARELIERGHDLTIYATGNENEAAGFQGLDYEHLQLAVYDLSLLTQGYDAVVTGLSGYDTLDGRFLRAANRLKIPTIAVQDMNSNYVLRLGTNPADLPTLLAVMSEDCIETARKELGDEMGEEAAKKSRVVGWAAFDHYAKMREDFTEAKRTELLSSIGINPENPVYVHFTQTMHPEAAYLKRLNKPYTERMENFLYEQGVTQCTFEAASDLGLKLVVKPHPGEEYSRNYTKYLADRHGFTFIPPSWCSTPELILAANSVTAGRSTCLVEGTLLDRNTGGILPEIKEEELTPFPPVVLEAIPYTLEWRRPIIAVLEMLTNPDLRKNLAANRKKFSVDGKAAKRLADLVESLR